MKVPTPYQASKAGAILMIVGLIVNAIGFAFGIPVKYQIEAVIGMAIFLILFLVQMRRHGKR